MPLGHHNQRVDEDPYDDRWQSHHDIDEEARTGCKTSADLGVKYGDQDAKRRRDQGRQGCHLEGPCDRVPDASPGCAEVSRRILQEKIDPEYAHSPSDQKEEDRGKRNEGDGSRDDCENDHKVGLESPRAAGRG